MCPFFMKDTADEWILPRKFCLYLQSRAEFMSSVLKATVASPVDVLEKYRATKDGNGKSGLSREDDSSHKTGYFYRLIFQSNFTKRTADCMRVPGVTIY